MDFTKLNERDLHRVTSEIVYDALPDTGTKIKATDILGQNAPYDILWEDTKICVRAANMSTRSRFPRWSYSVGTDKNEDMVDMLVLLALKGKDIYKVFVIPPEIAPKVYIAITEKMGQLRFEMFTTELSNLGEKIEEVKKDLPKLKELYDSARG